MTAQNRLPRSVPVTVSASLAALLMCGVACGGGSDDTAAPPDGAGGTTAGTSASAGSTAAAGASASKGGAAGKSGAASTGGAAGKTTGKGGSAGASAGGSAGASAGASAKGGSSGATTGKGGSAGDSAGKGGSGTAGTSSGTGGSGTAGTGTAGTGMGTAGMGTAGMGTAGMGTAGMGTAGSPTDIPGWKLSWSDEFDGPDGSAIDGSKWSAEEGGDGWGNQEREYYTKSTDNARQEGGHLVIEARSEGASQHNCWYGACQFTSARLVTSGKFEQTYGRFESRIQIPEGQGMWPAFWMLGNDIGSAGWPTCGEIDIMENIGKEPQTVHGSLHGPDYVQGLTSSKNLPSNAKLGDDYHVYATEWEPTEIRFYIDGMLYKTFTTGDIPGGAKWVFDHPNFILLNLAVGGQWPGDPDGSTQIPQQMKVDYVRVYVKS